MLGDFGKYKIRRSNQESIEAEEIFLDSKRLKESIKAEQEKLESPIKRKGIYFLYFLIIIFLLILFGRIVDLQIIRGSYWRSLAEGNRIRSYPIKSLRGIIYDRNGSPLVSNEPEFDLTIVPADLIKQKDELPEILNYLAEVSIESKQEIEKLLKENANFSIPIIVKENISRETALILESKFSENPALSIEISSRRNYIDSPYFSHVLGYLGRINTEELQEHKNYLRDDWLGKTGLEYYYEDLLRGSYGERLVEVDSQGKIKNIFGQKEPRVGKNIFLSIDEGLQKKLYDEIRQMLRRLKTNRAAGVALNPNTGEVLALVSFPNINNNKFIHGFTKEELEKNIQDPTKPFLNRVISGVYPPGSTIKPLIAAAVLKEGVVTPNQTINCIGSITVYNKYYPNIFRIFHDWKAHGTTNIIKAIAESCNVYFYTVGGGYGEIEGLGIEKISYFLKKFGLGKILGIDLPGETKGLIPDKNWKEKTKNEDWYIGDTYNVSIGQGDIMATPLQVALATVVIANNGTLFKPQIVSRVGDKPISSQVLEENIIDNEEVFRVVKKGMREAVISGSAKYLYDLPVKVAGKTGTAEAPGNKNPHGWFTCFAPYEKPKIVLTILIENGGEGSSVAVPIAKDVLKWYFSQ